LALVVLFFLRVLLIQGWQPLDRLRTRLALIARTAGLAALVLFAIGLFRTSSAEHHAWLIFGRYSLKYTVILAMVMLSGCVAVFAAPLIARLAELVLQAPERISQAASASTSQQNLVPYLSIFLILALSSLVIPQISTRAHINHTYAGLVLLIPLAIANRRILLPWVAMVAIHFYSHLSGYQLGRSLVLPQRFLEYPPAQSLISQINAALITQTYDPLLQFQSSINQFLAHYLPQEPLVSLLSAVQFICVVIIMREMFGLVARPMSGAILDSALGGRVEL